MPESVSGAAAAPVLQGLKILDIAHQYSGALSAGLLADLGADVVAVEHPSKTAIRTMLPRKGEHSMWWKVIQRGKRVVTLDLSTDRGRELLLQLAPHFDVMVENFRPGTLERWGLGPEDLEAAGLDIVLLRISGFGQTGPYRTRPGFGTIAEATSGFAHLNGEPDGPPMFPSSTLADGVAATFGGLGVLAALWNRLQHKTTGVEVVDVALFEGLFRLIPTQIAQYDQFGVAPLRPGNKLTSHGVLRNLYRSRDERYFAISAVGPVPIRRVMMATGDEELARQVAEGVMMHDPSEVVDFLDACDVQISEWASGLDYEDISAALEEAGVVYQQVYAADDIMRDPHFHARGDLIRVPDPALGDMVMQGVVPKFTKHEHTVAHAGPERGAHTTEVLQELLALDEETLKELENDGVI